MEGSDSHADGKQLQGVQMSPPHSCLPRLCGRLPTGRGGQMGWMLVPQLSQPGAQRDAWRRQVKCRAPRAGEAPLAWGQNLTEGTPLTLPANYSSFFRILSKRVSALLPFCSMGFLSQGSPTSGLFLMHSPHWSSYSPPSCKVHAQERASSTGGRAVGAARLGCIQRWAARATASPSSYSRHKAGILKKLFFYPLSLCLLLGILNLFCSPFSSQIFFWPKITAATQPTALNFVLSLTVATLFCLFPVS